jgi:predicted RNA-binding Zn ribbon-like protein
VDYPKLGLPLPLELVNTTFVSSGQPCDALGSPADLDAWFCANAEHVPALRSAATTADLDRFRSLRRALRRILSAVADEAPVSIADIETLNAYSAAAPQFVQLDWLRPGPRLTLVSTADATSTALAAVARAAIELLAGPDLKRISRCHGPGCVLFFLREPRRRHWCSPACGNRARVARHYSRHRPARAVGRPEREAANSAKLA